MTFNVKEDEVTYSDYLYGRGHPQGQLISGMFNEVDAWFDRLRTWLEASIDQDMDPEHPIDYAVMPGQGLHLMTDDQGIISLPASANSIHVNVVEFDSTTLPLLRKAVKQANRRLMPDDAHLLLRDSRAALRRSQFRRAVIDAGSAVELTLADFNRTVTRVTWQRNPTLGTYVLNTTIAASARLPTNLQRDLVNIRNAAIHQNQIPTRPQAALAISLAASVVNRLNPLPI